MKPATERFSDRVDDYAKYRPSYPVAVLDFLRSAEILRSSSVVADVGSGTGLLSRLFVESGHDVFAIEPNGEMREAGERALRSLFERYAEHGVVEFMYQTRVYYGRLA